MALKENYTFQSADEEKTTIHAVKWAPENGGIKAAIQLNHGMIEYIERYSQFAEFLADRGFVVMGHDHIGHGDSVKDPSDWGNLHTDTPSDTVIEDMMSNYHIIREQYPDVPFFIFGHSMGSYLLRKLLCERASELSGVNGAIIMGTGAESNAAISVGSFVVKMSIGFHGRDHKSASVAKLMFGPPYKRFDLTGKDPSNSWLSKNVDSVTKYYNDPKDTFMFSLNGYRLLLECTKYDNDIENLKKMNKDLPLLITSGTDDPVGGLSKGVTAAYEKYKAAGIKDVTLKLYEGDRHELLQETDRETVFSDILKWMTQRM